MSEPFCVSTSRYSAHSRSCCSSNLLQHLSRPQIRVCTAPSVMFAWPSFLFVSLEQAPHSRVPPDSCHVDSEYGPNNPIDPARRTNNVVYRTRVFKLNLIKLSNQSTIFLFLFHYT